MRIAFEDARRCSMGKDTSFRLSAEELAMALNLAGRPDMAKGLLVSHFGEIDEKEMRSRLLAASHSLMSKGLLSVEPEKGEPRLDGALVNAVSPLIQADFTIRYSRVQKDAEQHLAYQIRGETIVEHQVRDGVVHLLSQVSGQEEVVERGISFLGLRESDPFACSEAEIAPQALEEAKRRAQTQPETVAAWLRDIGVSESTSNLLSEDLQHTEYRGSVLRIEYQADGGPSSDYGFLVLRGPRRLWLFRLLARGAQPAVRIRPGTEQNFEQEVRLLFQKSRGMSTTTSREGA